MRLITHPRCAALSAESGGWRSELGTDRRLGARAAEIRNAPTPEQRRTLQFARGEAAPTIAKKRKAVDRLRRTFGLIDADFSEAYEQCRNDAQRKALEDAHRAAKKACHRAPRAEYLDDRDGWASALIEFNADRAKAEQRLSGLESATAVTRVLKRLGAMAGFLAILAA